MTSLLPTSVTAPSPSPPSASSGLPGAPAGTAADSTVADVSVLLSARCAIPDCSLSGAPGAPGAPDCMPQRCSCRPKFDFFKLMPMIPANWAISWNDFSMVSRNACSPSGTVSPKRAATLRSALSRCSGSTSEIRAQSSFENPARIRIRSSAVFALRTFPAGSLRMLLTIRLGNPQVRAIPMPRSSKVRPSTWTAATSSVHGRCSMVRLISSLSSGK